MTNVTLTDVQQMAQSAAGQISRVYLHWSAGHYGQFFEDYHISIDQDGSLCASTSNLAERKAHTWRRNSGAVGITMACCYKATSNDLGPEPPTQAQIESMARVVAALCSGLGLDIEPTTVMTHAEIADVDGYGPGTTCERWDLAILQNGDEWMSGGGIIRGKAIWYQNNGLEA